MWNVYIHIEQIEYVHTLKHVKKTYYYKKNNNINNR